MAKFKTKVHGMDFSNKKYSWNAIIETKDESEISCLRSSSDVEEIKEEVSVKVPVVVLKETTKVLDESNKQVEIKIEKPAFIEKKKLKV